MWKWNTVCQAAAPQEAIQTYACHNVGMAELPLDFPVEIELVAEVE